MFVAPLRIAGGIPSKTLDALAAGCPVVTTTIGNDGLGATPGEHLLVADAPPSSRRPWCGYFAIRRCVAGGAAGTRFAAERYGPDVSAAALERDTQPWRAHLRSPDDQVVAGSAHERCA